MVKNIDTASDWLNMFTKASEQLYLAFVSKMPKRTPEQQRRFNEQRQCNKRKSRQALFTSEYVQTKYFDVYNEACTFFNALNSMYPTKYDLRKTVEFREWKAACIHGKTSEKRKRTLYLDVENPPPMSTYPQTQSRTHTDTESPPRTPTETQSRTHTDTESPPGTPTETQSRTHTESSPTQYNDRLQLEIPLQDYNTHKKSTVTTQTLEITTEQEIQPITIDDIPSERVDEIIEQLRQDPDLRDVFSSVEEQMEFEQLGMDLDIPELNLLEEELLW